MIQMKHLYKEYNRGKENSFLVLKDISLEIRKGEMVAFMGKSGAGKSTLMHIMACLDDFDQGEYYLEGRSIRQCSQQELAQLRNRTIGIVIQSFALMEDCTVMDNVLLPLDIAGGEGRKERIRRGMKILEEVGMEHMWDHEVCTLSGGEKQRTAIARALVNNPALIIADEPTGALDTANSQEVMELLKRLNEQGMTVIIVTHDVQIARQCGRVIFMKDGALCQAAV